MVRGRGWRSSDSRHSARRYRGRRSCTQNKAERRSANQMTLSEALGVINTSGPGDVPRSISLVCGFEPLHLATFLQAHATQRSQGASVEVHAGVYGDLIGN